MTTIQQPEQFFRPTQRGEFVAVERVQMNPAFCDGFYELALLFGSSLLQIAVDGPKDFAVPLETSTGRIVGRPARQVHGLFQMLPLPQHHFRLDVSESDVDVRMGQNVQMPGAHRFQGEFRLRHGLAGDVQDKTRRRVGRNGGNEHLGCLAAQPKLQPHRFLPCQLKRGVNSLDIGVVNGRFKRLQQAVALSDQCRESDWLDRGLNRCGFGLTGDKERDLGTPDGTISMRSKFGDFPAHVPSQHGSERGECQPATRVGVFDIDRCQNVVETAIVAEDQLRGGDGGEIKPVNVFEGGNPRRLAEIEDDERVCAVAGGGVLTAPTAVGDAVQHIVHVVATAGIGWRAIDDGRTGQRTERREKRIRIPRTGGRRGLRLARRVRQLAGKRSSRQGPEDQKGQDGSVRPQATRSRFHRSSAFQVARPNGREGAGGSILQFKERSSLAGRRKPNRQVTRSCPTPHGASGLVLCQVLILG